MEFKEIFSENLKSKFEKKEIEKIESIFDKTLNEINEINSKKTEREIPLNEKSSVEIFFDKLSEKPETISSIITEIKKPNWTKSFLKITIAIIVILPISILSWKGILGTCETATLFGGIVGYLLGDLN